MAKLKTGRHTSGLKAHRQSERRASHNRGITKQIRTAAKDLVSAVNAKDSKAVSMVSDVASKWDKAAKKGIVHWRTAARKKSRLTKLANSVKKA